MISTWGKRPMLIKTDLAREFEKDLTERLKEYAPIFEEFKNYFDPRRHFIEAEYNIYTPKSELFTVSGAVSARSTDVDAHKLLQDVIFKSMKLDDKLIRDCTYVTPVSLDDKWNYIIVFRLVRLEALYV
jgi:hypothetical protein